MWNSYLKTYLFLTLLLSDFLMFADDGPGGAVEDENGNTDGSVEGVPINGKLAYLVLVAVAFAYYSLRKKEGKAIQR